MYDRRGENHGTKVPNPYYYITLTIIYIIKLRKYKIDYLVILVKLAKSDANIVSVTSNNK